MDRFKTGKKLLMEIKIKTRDYHTAGEPLRIIESGFPEISGKKILEIRSLLSKDHDHLRKTIINEPRGHYDMYACLPTPPERPDSKFGMVFLHNEGYSTMCGHAVIAMGKYYLDKKEIGLAELETGIKADTPAGQVVIFGREKSDTSIEIGFRNVPSFVESLDNLIMVKDRQITFDLAYGGAYYALVDADDLKLSLKPENSHNIRTLGMDIKREIEEQFPINHPLEKDLSFLYGVIFVSYGSDVSRSKNVCVFADGQIDRSPTGTGVSARAAVHFERKQIGISDEIVVCSIIDTCFMVRVVETEIFQGQKAVIPEVWGTAYYTGTHEFAVDPNDPIGPGFMIR